MNKNRCQCGGTWLYECRHGIRIYTVVKSVRQYKVRCSSCERVGLLLTRDTK